jgi:hypothetical protein
MTKIIGYSKFKIKKENLICSIATSFQSTIDYCNYYFSEIFNFNKKILLKLKLETLPESKRNSFIDW